MIVQKLKELISTWNDEQKCGVCWQFVATFNDHIQGGTNLFRPEDCCRTVFLEGLRSRTVKKDNGFGFQVMYCEYFIHLKILEQSDFGMQKGTELGFDTGIYDEVIAPIEECLGCDFGEICETFGMEYDITEQSHKPTFSIGDQNWAGLDYRMTIRKNLS